MYKNSDVFNIEKLLKTAKAQDREKLKQELELALDADAAMLVYNAQKQLVHVSTDSRLHESLARALASKYINKGTYIKSLRACWLYCSQGWQRITVYDNSGWKTEYFVKY